MSDDHTARLALPYLAAGQLQKHVTLNEALTRLDALVQTAVVSATSTAQPSSPVDGDLYILPAGATGAAWSGQPAGALMRAEAGGWNRIPVPDGLVVLVRDVGQLWVRDADGWIGIGSRLGQVQNLDRLGLGTSADPANPFAARLNKALWTALEAGSGGDGDLRLTLNKEAATDVLSLLFQTGFSGRAEIGLIGDDDLRLKVSSDGSSWREAVSVDRATGRVMLPLGAGQRLVTVFSASGGYTVPSWARSVTAVAVGGGGGGAGAFGASGSRFGGGGGGAGGISRASWPAELLRAESVSVVVGPGGAGGTTTGGSAGGSSSVQLGSTILLTALGGGGGGLGSASSGPAGTAGAGVPASNGGGASSVVTAGATGRSLDRPDAPGGGGGGGGLDGSGVARAGGAGGDGGTTAVRATGGAGGSATSGTGGSAAPLPDLHWAGGGGGGGGAVNTGGGHAGASGGLSGGGGGGGGAGLTARGTGGSGAAGTVWMIAVG